MKKRYNFNAAGIPKHIQLISLSCFLRTFRPPDRQADPLLLLPNTLVTELECPTPLTHTVHSRLSQPGHPSDSVIMTEKIMNDKELKGENWELVPTAIHLEKLTYNFSRKRVPFAESK